MKFLVKTQRGMESVAGNYIREALPNAEVWASPMGYSGLVIVETNDENAEEKLLEIPEVERVIPVLVETNAELKEIEKAADEIASLISKDETFAVKTKRRGKHDFSSIDVNRVLGARIKELTDADVNLSWPDKVVQVEIIGIGRSSRFFQGGRNTENTLQTSSTPGSSFPRLPLSRCLLGGRLQGLQEVR